MERVIAVVAAGDLRLTSLNAHRVHLDGVIHEVDGDVPPAGFDPA